MLDQSECRENIPVGHGIRLKGKSQNRRVLGKGGVRHYNTLEIPIMVSHEISQKVGVPDRDLWIQQHPGPFS